MAERLPVNSIIEDYNTRIFAMLTVPTTPAPEAEGGTGGVQAALGEEARGGQDESEEEEGEEEGGEEEEQEEQEEQEQGQEQEGGDEDGGAGAGEGLFGSLRLLAKEEEDGEGPLILQRCLVYPRLLHWTKVGGPSP